jgi:putative spermidine/putrescine transport system substrate-binding protein
LIVITPRSLLAVLAIIGAVSLAACGGDDSSSGGGEPSGVVFLMGPGGDVFEIYEESWWGPLEDRTDLTFRSTAPSDFTKLKGQVDSGNVSLDIANISTTDQYHQGIDEGLIERLDRRLLQKYMTKYKAGDLDRDFLPGSIGTHGVWDAPYGTILVFDEREFPPSGPQPDSLDDLWNLKEFPGKRCLNNTANYNLDIALSADGVPESELYPLDVDRALEKLDEIKPEVAKFWTEGTEPIQLVANGECVMSTVWNGRPFAAEVVQGIDYLGVAWENGMLDTSWVTIPSGGPNREGAYAAIAYYLRPDVGAAIANGTGYPHGNKKISGRLTPEAREYLATEPENLEAMTNHNPEWWLENGAEAEERFAEWLGS